MDSYRDGWLLGGEITKILKMGGVPVVDIFDKGLLKTMSDFELRMLREQIRAELQERHARRVAMNANSSKCECAKACNRCG